MMKIRKSTREDLPRILELYENARNFMAQHGNASQWGKTFPPAELIENDIAAGKSYVCLDVVHRIASDGVTKGAGTFCLNWALGKINNIKIDTHKDNVPMQKLLEKLGFVQCGIITIEDGTERIAFQRFVGKM